METSDSECFESADEDLDLDEEKSKCVNVNLKTESITSKHVDLSAKQLDSLTLTSSNVITSNDNKPTDSSNLPKDESIFSESKSVIIKEKSQETGTNKPEQKVKGVKAKLGMKVSETQHAVKQEPIVKEKSPKLDEIVQDQKKTTTDIAASEFVWDEVDWEQESEETNKENSVKKIDEESKLKIDETKGNEKSQNTNKTEKVDQSAWNDMEVDWEKENEETSDMWNNDDWGSEEFTPQTPSSQPEKKSEVSESSWGSWGNWGVSSIITTATQGVSTLTQGLSTALESGIGVPDPEELARINKAQREKLKSIDEDAKPEVDNKNSSGFGLGNLVMGVSHLTKLVETTGTKVIAGGLDTLETIGKKTMEVLQEGDPGLKKKRAFLKIDQDKPVLSQLLREAKEKADNENKILEQKHFAKKAKNYETLFDDHQGLVHLEALEMLSRQCDIKLRTLLDSHFDEELIEMQETMDQVKELCELPDEDEDEQTSFEEIKEKLQSAIVEINVPISYKRLIELWEETEVWLGNLNLDVCDARELHQQAIETLAQLTAIAVEQFHKTGELLLVKDHRSTADEADSLVQLTTALTSLFGIVAAKFTDKLNTKSSESKNKEEINGLITNVFYEAANSSSYLQDAFQLLIPVLQVGAV